MAGCGGDGSAGGKMPTQRPPGTGSPSPVPTPAPTPVAAGSRILGIAATDRQDDNFDAVTQNVKDAGIANVTISLSWDEIETAPGVYDPDPNFAAIANLYFPAQTLSMTVVLVGIDTTADRRPDDLKNRAWDDPEIIARFREVQAWVLNEMSNVEITAYSIGNEVDATLGSDPSAWQAWRAFFEAVAPDARAALPGIAVGSKATSNVLDNPVSRREYSALLSSADASMLTYYPAGLDFQSSQLPDVAMDFDRMLSAYPGLPLRLLECGFSSDTQLGSSEQKQADFVSAVFRAWDTNINNIPQLDYFAVHDLSPDAVEFFRNYYGISGANFAIWLGSLGLRQWDGTPKIGWQRFVDEAAARSFRSGAS